MTGERTVTTTKIGDTDTETAVDQPKREYSFLRPRRPIAPIPQPVRWGKPMPFERRPFDAEITRRRGCEVAAGIPLIGEL